MKSIIKLASLIGLLGMILGCTKDSLIRLDNKPMFVDNGDTRSIAKPEDVVVIGDVNKQGRIQWPKIAPTVESATVSITMLSTSSGSKLSSTTMNRGVQEFTVTNFDDDFILNLDEITQYRISIVFNSKNGSVSKPVFFDIIPQNYDINLISEDFLITPLSGKLRFEFNKRVMGDYEYIIKYQFAGKEFVHTFASSVDSTDSYIINDITDDNHDYNFSVVIKDKGLNKSSDLVSRIISPLPYPSIAVAREMTERKWLDGGLLSWFNRSGEKVKIKVNYTINGITYTREKETLASSDTLGIKDFPIGTHDVFIHLEDEYGATSSITRQIIVDQPSAFLTTADKRGWQAAVSSNHVGDGGGGPALVDGNTGTYWHTPWSGNVPNFPHTATVTFPSLYKLTKAILRLRDHNTPNGPGKINIQISSNGVDFNTLKSFDNTINTKAGEVVLPFDLPVYSKYVRFVFNSSLSNTAFMNLSEISFEGYSE